MATVILGIAAAGVLLPFTTGAAVQAEGAYRTLAAKLAADLIEEIVDTPFDQIEGSFNYTESQGQVKDTREEVFSGSNYANFSREVSCGYVYVPQEKRVIQSDGQAEVKFILATVSVYYQGREIVVLNRLITE